jgi:phage-related protein (TIGR01555 family)
MNNDSLRSLITGMGDPSIDKAASLSYGHTFLSDQQLLNAYRNTWLAKKIINIPAMDALRKWREWQADQSQITMIEAEERRLGLKQKMLWCKTLARLWGGAVMYIGDGGDASKPWEPESIKKGGLKYLTVMSRREIVAGELNQDPTAENYGWPISYQVSNGLTFLDIHPSRIVLQIGELHPDPWNVSTNVGWGDSSLQSVWSAVTNADATASNIASLVFEANVDVYKIQDLMEHMSSAAYRTKLIDRFTLANIGKSVTKALITDSDEEYDRKQIAFTGLPDVLQQFLILVSGAADIPLTRLLGQSPSGLSSTGEHDMKNYYDRIASIQALEIGPALYKLDEALIRSALGNRPDEIFYTWAPLEQMSEKELAEIGKMNADTANVLTTTGLFMPEELREVVGNQLIESSFYPGLGDLLKKNGEQLPEFDLERRASEVSVNALENPEPKAKLNEV